MDTNLALLRKARDHLAQDYRRRDMAKAVEQATDMLIKLSDPANLRPFTANDHRFALAAFLKAVQQ